MRLRKVAEGELKSRAFELTLKVGNVMAGRHAGVVSDTKATEILLELAERNEDLVLQEHANPEVKEMMRNTRIALLPFSKRPFAM
jgi:hypothetical protein